MPGSNQTEIHTTVKGPGYYGGPQVHSEFQTTLLILNLTPHSKTSLRILKTHSKFKNLTPNSKHSLLIQKTHSANTETTVYNNVNKVEKLQQDFDELKQLLYANLL